MHTKNTNPEKPDAGQNSAIKDAGPWFNYETREAMIAERDTLRADNERLRSALKACHDCLNANFATHDSIEGNRATAAMNQARAALSAKESEAHA